MFGKRNGKKTTTKKDLTEGKVWFVLTMFVLPIIAGSIIQQMYTTVDAIIVGRFVGKTGLAAINSVATLFKFPLNFMGGLSGGTTVIISRYYGSKNKDELGKSVRTALTMSIVMGIVFSVIGVSLAPWMLTLMKVPGDIFALTLSYVRVYFAGIFATVMYNNAAGILRAYGDSATPLYILIVCGLFNVAADYLFVGVFGWSVAGAAYATIMAQVISAIIALYVIERISKEEKQKIFLYPEFSFAHAGSMVTLGIPLGIKSILFPIANSIVASAVNGRGTDVIAAWGVCGTLDLLIWLIADSMGSAQSTFVAQNLGANQHKRAYKGTFIGVALTVVPVALVSIGLFFAAGSFGHLFVPDSDAPAVIPLVIEYMRLMAPFYVFYGLYAAFSGAICGAGQTLIPTALTLTFTCLLRVLAIFFVLPHFESMECIIWIYITSWIVTGVVFTAMFQFLYHKWNK